MDHIKQYKTVDDLKEIIKSLEGFMSRPVIRGKHPTIYPEVSEGIYRTVCGIRIEADYLVTPDEKFVLPHNQKGLSFSSNWKELNRVYRMFKRVKGVSVDVYWVLQGADLPPDMAFVEDQKPKKQGHYFLTVTKKMPIHRLAANLRWVADRMSVIKNAEKAL